MKKSYDIKCVCVFLLLTVANIAVTQPSDQLYTHTFVAQTSIGIGRDAASHNPYFSGSYSFVAPYLKADTGFEVQPDTFSFVAKVAGSPLNFLQHCIDIYCGYEVNVYQGAGCEHNLLFSLAYTFLLPEKFIQKCEIGYLHKWFYIPVKNSSPLITDMPTLLMCFSSEVIFKKAWFLGFGMSSFETFLYPLFLHPTFNLSLYYHFTRQTIPRTIFAGIDFRFRYSDIFTLTSHIDGFLIRASLGITL